eukprot:Gregarina_sp_Poly_1__1556@NODE_1394_length_4224_cov_86_295165_g179_i1_p2_GENE_NODE_1394_length_4224_cov_86_295165_g179_i1NODE_1394_length_4224_cov_86_295165_g179_i1_p2_ORF_typecomplete_len174_score38_65ORC2/PF04084_14/2_1e05MADF_DNA_bdg/PF10545_9/76MADF_DNA_bdg/PF10545_9/0_089DHC/PF09626_10/80DHC/PF09626_10/1_4_NODE_1394_length_4224_cov_86_295165_g179_i1103624
MASRKIQLTFWTNKQLRTNTWHETMKKKDEEKLGEELKEEIRQDLVSFRFCDVTPSLDDFQSIFAECRPPEGMNQDVFQRTHKLATAKHVTKETWRKILSQLNFGEDCEDGNFLENVDESGTCKNKKQEIRGRLIAQFPEWMRILFHRRMSLIIVGIGSKLSLMEEFVEDHVL